MTETTFGDYDRDQETNAILADPPAAAGDPGTSTVATTLADLFKEQDADRFATFKATAPNGAELALEFDTRIEPEEWNRYQRMAGTGNRASRRAGTEEREVWRSAAAMLTEKSVKITELATGVVYKDAKERPLTLRSEEWLAAADHPNDPIGAAVRFFGFAQVVTLGNGYMVAAGLDDEAERVDPTSA